MATAAARSNHVCKSCVPSDECKSAIHKWLTVNGRGLFVGINKALKRVSMFLPALLSCSSSSYGAEPLLVDVGAGIHGKAASDAFLAANAWPTTRRGQPIWHPDDSDALVLLSAFGTRARVHAFEPNRRAARLLMEGASRRNATRNFTSHLSVHPVGVGDARMAGNGTACGRANRFTVRTSYGADHQTGGHFDRCENVQVTTLDDSFGPERLATQHLRRGRGSILYLKVDVEGGEWAVLDGAERLLRAQRVEVLSLEYAVGWHHHFHLARPLTPAERLDVQRPLRRLVERLDGYGYDAYLMHALSESDGVTLVPVHGAFWHDDFEICFDRGRFYGNWGWNHSCWNDLLVVRRCNRCVRRKLFEDVLPATDWRAEPRKGKVHAPRGAKAFPECGCL